MKVELTKQIKNKFFATYWGVNAAFVPGLMREGPYPVDDRANFGQFHMSHLLLRPISTITNEEALVVAEIFDVEEPQIKDTNLPEWIEALFEEEAGYYIDRYRGDQLLHAIDYLRAKGFALSFMGHPVRELVALGWIKLAYE